MSRQLHAMIAMLAGAVLALCAASAEGTSLQNLVDLKGHAPTTLTGMGIVTGLNGTGDSSKGSYIAARPYAQLMRNLGNSVENLDELLGADTFAIVEVTITVPATGINNGQLLDARISTMFNATSLEGGTLFVSPVRLPVPDSPDSQVYAIAQGAVTIEGTNPRVGVVRQGGQMIADILSDPVDYRSRKVTLMLRNEFVSYPNAQTLAEEINDEFQIGGGAPIAIARDARNIEVRLQDADMRNPSEFIGSLMQMPIEQSLMQVEAKIIINEKRGTIIITGDVELGPVAVVARGLSIRQITPQLPPTAENPRFDTTNMVRIDPTDGSSRTSTRLADLIDAFEQLKVPIDDQIAILEDMKQSGALVAKIEWE